MCRINVLNDVSSAIDDVISDIEALKSASYPIFQIFFCVVVIGSNICGVLNHAVNALNHLAGVTLRRKASELNKAEVTLQAQQIIDALNLLANKLRKLCIALTQDFVKAFTTPII